MLNLTSLDFPTLLLPNSVESNSSKRCSVYAKKNLKESQNTFGKDVILRWILSYKNNYSITFLQILLSYFEFFTPEVFFIEKVYSSLFHLKTHLYPFLIYCKPFENLLQCTPGNDIIMALIKSKYKKGHLSSK